MATKKAELVKITALDIKHINMRIVGTSPLICHAWSEKAKRQMLEAQTGGRKAKKKEAKNPVADFIHSLYWLEGKPGEEAIEADAEKAFMDAVEAGARFGFPVGGIKQAANSAAYRMNWVPNQMALRGAYFLRTVDGEYAEIKGCVPEMREDMVRVGMGAADIRYRGEFREWYMDFVLEYNASGAMSLEDILNCINAGGYTVGIGEWRPEKDGAFGTFRVETQPAE